MAYWESKLKTEVRERRIKFFVVMKVIFSILIFASFLPMASAFLFDNCGQYDEETRTMTIINAFCLGDTIAKVTLRSPDKLYVIPGEERRVAWYYIENYEENDGDDVFGIIETFDLKRGNSQINKNFVFKKMSLEEVEVPVYIETCIGAGEFYGNGTEITECTVSQDGTRVEYREEWSAFNRNHPLEVGNYTIGLFTEVENDERVEWIPTIYGVEIDEWAIWTASFNKGLQGYWSFENNTERIDGVMNLTPDDGQISFLTSSLNGKAGYFDATHNMLFDNTATGTSWEFPVNTTLSFWSNRTGGGIYFNKRSGGTGWFVGLSGSDIIVQGMTASDLNTPYTANIWTHYVIRRNTTSVSLWEDGILRESQTSSVVTRNVNIALGSGTRLGESDYEGEYDEFALWNRSLSDSEISDLYDGGTGTFYTNLQSTLNLPADNFASSNPIIEFNCTGSIGSGTIANISLWTNQSGTFQIENTTTGLTQSVENVVWNHDLVSEGNYIWNCEACGSNDFCTFALENRTVTIDASFPQVNITYPITVDYHAASTNLTLNWTITELNLDSCWYNYDGTNVTVTCADNTTSFNVTSYDDRDLYFYANDTAGNLNTTFHEWDYIVFENLQTYNSTAYETAQETFSVNITYNSSQYTSSTGTLYYSGTAYSGTKTGSGNNIVFTKTMDIPTVTSQTDRSFNWQIALTNSSGANYYNSTSYNQTVNNISLSLCGGVGGSVSYINFTFKDEETDLYINASTDLSTWIYYLGSGDVTDSLIFTNITVNPSYAYCFTPPDKTLNYEVVYQYAASGYPQRRYVKSGTLTNTTTNTLLYLLGSGDGIYSSFQIVTQYGQTIPGAIVQVERQFSGVWTLVGEGTSDSSGLATFWLNPNYDHKITVTKTGYVGTTATIRPTQSIYTIVLSGVTANETYSTGLEGIYFTKTPASGILSPGTYDFTFNVTAQNNNMVNCKMELTNVSGYILDSATSACTTNALLTINSYTITEGDVLYGKYYVDLGEGYILLEGDANWFTLTTNLTGTSTLKAFFEYLSDPTIWAEDEVEQKKYEFTKFVAFFLILSLALAFANHKTGFDNQNPGIILFGLPFLMLFVSIAGAVSSVGDTSFLMARGFFYMEGATTIAFFDNYLIAVYSLLIAVGFYFAQLRRGK